VARADSPSGHPPYVALPVVALTIVGVIDLLFERIVYRIGIHVPKDESAMRAYRGATSVGDGAFRYVMVLAVFAGAAVAIYLVRQRGAEQRLAGAALIAVAALDTLTIRNNNAWLGMAVVVTYGGALALLFGVIAGSRLVWSARAAAASASVALLAGVYPLFATRTRELSLAKLPTGATPLTVSEAAIVATALLLFVAARPWASRRRAVVLGAGAVAGGLAAIASIVAPATVAILALWGVGVTMSFPAPVYILALGAAVSAAATFALDGGTRPLTVAMVLLAVAGLQPTVTQYNVPALIGIGILAFGAPAAAPVRRADSIAIAEATDKFGAGHRTHRPVIEGAR
jgi:hypothetical protein